MKIVIDISEDIYNTIMSDLMPDKCQMSAIVTRIYQGILYEEKPQDNTKMIISQGECKTCRHRDPEDKKCDCGAKE